jgi:hypothetical protein
MAPDPDVPIPEPVHLSEFEAFLADLGDEHAPARGTQIDGDDACHLRAGCAFGCNL